MKKLSKWLMMIIAISMIISSAAACTPTSDTSPAETTEAGETTTAAEQETTDDDDDDGDTETTEPEDDLEPYELTWFMLCNTISPDVEMVEEQMNSIIEPLINATININMLDWGTWSERFPTAMNAGEVIDVSFTADWWFLLDYVANNFLTPLNDPADNLMEQYAPQVLSQLGDGFILGSQIGGVNYAVPTDKEFAVNAGFVWNQDLADKYDFDMSGFDENTKLEDFEDMLAVIKENEPDIIPYLMDNGGWMFTVPFTSFVSRFGVLYDDLDDTEIKFEWELESRVEMARVHQRFYQQGYIHRDAYTDNHRANDHLLEGNFFLIQQPLKPFAGKSNELMSAGGNRYTLKEVETTPYVGTSLHAAGSMLAIPTTSGDPERAMMFINIMHTNEEASNTMVWGVEGRHHTIVEEGPPRIVTTVADNTWTSAALPWTLGNVFNHWLGEHEDPRKHEGFRLTKEEADKHITLGYRFINTQEYQAELAAIDNAALEYNAILATGAVENFDDTLASLISAVEAAGMRTVQEAIQEDLDAWLAGTR